VYKEKENRTRQRDDSLSNGKGLDGEKTKQEEGNEEQGMIIEKRQNSSSLSLKGPPN
jgi:hypothetical protein